MRESSWSCCEVAKIRSPASVLYLIVPCNFNLETLSEFAITSNSTISIELRQQSGLSSKPTISHHLDRRNLTNVRRLSQQPEPLSTAREVQRKPQIYPRISLYDSVELTGLRNSFINSDLNRVEFSPSAGLVTLEYNYSRGKLLTLLMTRTTS